uniref:Uncharacterized protein n=1 Tax=Leptobrachium leishanense TaxID=445787 RepID=A0A8C5Q645_9ANUR
MDKKTDARDDEDSGRFEDGSPVQCHHADFLDVPCSQQEKIKKLQEELDTRKKENDISKGNILSLYRQVSLRESQLRKSESEKEGLQKQLMERLIQIQAMSAKFSNLREERKRDDMMAAIEKDNYNLRELVSELKSELIAHNKTIGELRIDKRVLQEQCDTYLTQIKRSGEEMNKVHCKLEDLKYSDQRMKITLERLYCRFERFISKIIQATYSAPNVVLPTEELTDDEILAALQDETKMQTQEAPAVQYSRWNDQNQDEVSVTTSSSEVSTWKRVWHLLCTGRIGIAMKVFGGLALFWIIFIIGYVTGYYVHKCKQE